MMDATQLLTYWLVYGLTYAISDAFEFLLCWLPLWPYLKLAFFLWLWYPATDGAGAASHAPCSQPVIMALGKRLCVASCSYGVVEVL